MTEEVHILYLKQNIQNTQEVIDKHKKEKHWHYPITCEELEDRLKEFKSNLSRLQKNPEFIHEIRKNLNQQLDSLESENEK